MLVSVTVPVPVADARNGVDAAAGIGAGGPHRDRFLGAIFPALIAAGNTDVSVDVDVDGIYEVAAEVPACNRDVSEG